MIFEQYYAVDMKIYLSCTEYGCYPGKDVRFRHEFVKYKKEIEWKQYRVIKAIVSPSNVTRRQVGAKLTLIYHSVFS